MVDELIARVKQMYYQLEQDDQRQQRMAVNNLDFGVVPPPTADDFGAAPEVEPPPAPPGVPPAGPPGASPAPGAPPQPDAAPPTSLLDLWSSRR